MVSWVVKSSDGRYVSKVDAWDSSPKVIFELTENVSDALRYPARIRAIEDADLFNNSRGRYARIRRFIVEKYGELTFEAVSVEISENSVRSKVGK